MEKLNEFLDKPFGKFVLVAVGVVVGILVGTKLLNKKPYGKR